MNCINTNTNEFKELKRATKLSTFELENVIYLYQSQNGTDEFPSIEYITSRTSDIMRTELNRTNDMIDQQQQMLEEHAVDVNYINTISDDLDTSIHIENHIREKVLIEAKEKGIKVKFANLANVTDKVLVINGEYVVNLSAIHQDDKLDTLLKPLQALTPEVIELAKNDINANNRKVITTKIKVLDGDSISTVQTSDIVGSVIYRNSKGQLMLTPNDGEALAIISNPDLTERQKRNRLDKISSRIFDSNMDTVSDSLLENKPFHIISKPNIETEYSDTMKALSVVTLALEQDRKGVFNLEKSESKAELLETIKQSTKDIKNDNRTFINSVEVSDKVTIQTLGPFEFKTEADMDNFLDDLAKIDNEMNDLVTKFRNDTISKKERSLLNHYLSQFYLDSRNQLLRDITFNNRFNNDLFEKTRLHKRYEAIRDKLKNTLRPTFNNRKSKTVSTKTVGSNTIVQSIIGEALKNTMNDATINIGERIDNVLDKLQLALLENDEEAIENLKYELSKLTSEMKAYTGKGYNPTGDYSKALMKIFNNIQNTTLSQRAVNTQSKLEYTPAQQAELAVLEANIERAQKTFNENIDKSFDTFKDNLKGSKRSKIRPGLEDLFDENPELANHVYKTLGLVDENGFKETTKYELSLGEAKFTGVKPFTKSEQAQIDKLNNQQKQQALEIYSQYLDTIFPESKVKDIVYRGKTENQTNKKSKELGIFFTDNKNAANIYAIKYKGDEFDDSIIQGIVNKFGLNPTIEQIKSEIAFFEKMGATNEEIEKNAKEFQKYILNNKGITEQAIINIKNPKNLTVKDWFDNYDNSNSLKENSDGLLLKGGKQSDNRIYDAGENQIVVFEPEQAHILGSKQDIEEFEKYAKNITPPISAEINTEIKNQFSNLINEGKTSIKDLNEAFSNASPELKKLFSKNKLAFRKYFQEYIKESDSLNRVLEESENQREFIESKATVISDNLNSTDNGDHVDLYKIPKRHKVAKNNINKNVQADAKIMETRYNEDYGQLYGNLRDNKNYAVKKENESDLQYKLRAISKALNANIILDENFEGRAALLSDNSHQVRRAREQGDNRPIIIMNPNFLLSDTVFHEFGHLYIELLGTDDKLVKEAIYLLAGTKLHERVAKEYPELNGIELDKEVLATALGMEADMIFARSIEKLVWWQNILRGMMDFLKRTFNIDQDALQKLASEMLSIRKTRVDSAEGYSSNITYYSKYQVDKEKKAQLEAKRIFEELRANVTINEETHKYSESGDELFQSITTIAGRMAGKKKIASDKGDFSMEFDKNLLDKDLIFNLLNSPRIPAPLAHALNDLINSRIQGVIPTADVKVGDNWHSVYLRENTSTIATELNIVEEALEKELLKNNPHLRKSLRQDIIDNFDAIMNRAEELNKRYKSASVMGNILHKAVENFIKDEAKNGRPINVENSREYFDMIQDIYDKGIAAGSMFFSEQVLYDEDTRSPGTADLVEITADGKFKIYDFKSVKSFKDKEGSDLNPYQLYYGKGYVHQLLSYGEILKKYGLEPHEDPYHILIAEVQPAEDGHIIESENESISLGNSKSISIKNLKGFESRYKKSQTDVTRYFKNKKVSRIDLKSEIENLEDATDKIYQVIRKFDKVLKSKTKDLDTANNFNSLKSMLDTLADTDAMKKHAEEVKYEYNRYISKQNTVVISKFLDSVHAVMGELRDTYSDGLAETSSRQIQALNYVLQVAESLYDIKKGLTPQELRKTNAFTEAEAIEIERKIDETIAAIKDNREFYSKKTIENAIHILASNDLEQMGFMVEQLEIEARKQGKRSKEEIAKYVQEHIKDKKDLLESQNLAAWTARFENGLLDVRTLEYLFADPGMINSQIVQIAKQMMNANDMFVRNVMMELGPMIENWYNTSSKGTGNTRQTWGKFLNKSSVYIPQTGKYETIEDGTLIPEFVSDKYYDKIEFENKMRNLNREKKYLLQKEGLSKETTEKLDKINEQIEKIKEEYNEKTSKMKPADLKKYLEKRINPDFKRLSVKEQEDLRFIHTQLREADDRIDNRAKRLSSYVGNDVIIYTLPKKRMDVHEAGISGFAANFKSKIKDIRRPPADEDTENITEDEMNPAESGTVITDVKGNQHLDIPVFYRNELEDPRLQSFDIPTLLLENHQTSLTYQQGTEMEADLFILKESVNKENNDKILKTDNLINKQLNDVSNRFTQKSENNNLHKAISSAIDQHLYKRGYSGTYTRGNYKVIKWAEVATRFGTINGLVGNFKSGMTTSLQGSIYRMIEGIAGEHFNMNDWKKGTLKTYQDIGDVIKDTQRHVHKSKSNLLARYFGLEQRASALANKFVQDNFVSKNLDSDTLYAVTSIAETMVTQMLMYSMLSNIKVMDKDQNYLDKDGNIVTNIKDAMSLDEAYTVEDGKLKLNPKVVYTTKNFVDKYAENGKVDFDVATRISSYMQNVYANMYGQYNENMKSAIQRTAAGKMVMSMKGWLARGMHNRFRGITSAVPFMESRLSFEDLRKPENIDKRFFSQASGTFHEGYHSTMIRYITDVYKEMGGKMNRLAFSSVYSNMTTHERANMKRSIIELALVLATFVMYKFVAALAKLYDDEDEEASEYFYFTAYMTYRLHDEIATFINPLAMMDMITNPAVAFNNFASIGKLLARLFGFEYSMEEGVDWSINDRYTKGDQKGNLKVTKDVLKLTPGVNNGLQFFGLLGFDTGRTMEDQFKNQMSATR